MSNQHVTACSS